MTDGDGRGTTTDDPEESLGRSVPAVAREYAPGVAALVVFAVAARLASDLVPHASALVVAVAFGIVVANTVGVPDVLAAGVRTHKFWLAAGIVLMGARVSLSTLVSAGPQIAVLVVGVVVATVLLVEGLSALVFDVQAELGSLLAAGASVCGVSAAVGVAGSIRASEDQLAYAAGTILLFDVVTLFVYPALAGPLGLSDRAFGVWAGLTMFSTGPVTAAGFAVSDVAGRWATITKLTRNLLLGVLVGAYSIRYANASEYDTAGSAFSPRELWRTFPKFVLGFFAVVLVASTPLVSDAARTQLTHGYRWLFLLAFAGLGLSVEFEDLRSTGLTPIVLLLTSLLVVSALAFVAVGVLL
ncbi:putative sulfate exporter family transporter [Halorubellus sp. JP-L1]|uniref:YeiH family protein n=1 Tax=Halorubellus sp. JP-L1 TaxID=2715753 RepID=UPI00140721DA|nr:putative sulfate exporter family transporter [Halorubellus sp. JP-L1]NHN43019.1 putative sulfate exporter family transporter [Halorubellus sp. JP-L1]